MSMKRNRFSYLMLGCITMVTGLGIRKLYNLLPYWLNTYLGDILWALMIFFLVGVILNKVATARVAFVAWIFCISIEISQLYQAQWIKELRETTLGGLILGYGFLWSDIIAYSIGIIFGVAIEMLLMDRRKNNI